MLASCTDALLAVDGADELAEIGFGVGSAQEEWFVLIHALHTVSYSLTLPLYQSQAPPENG